MNLFDFSIHRSCFVLIVHLKLVALTIISSTFVMLRLFRLYREIWSREELGRELFFNQVENQPFKYVFGQCNLIYQTISKVLSHGCFQLLKFEPFVNETIVREVIVDKVNQTYIKCFIFKFTILIGRSTIAWVKFCVTRTVSFV